MDFNHLLADRTGKMGVNVIREILKVVSQPGMVSLAGGIPAPESFPLELIQHLTQIVIEKYSSSAFQYGPTEGFGPLREVLADYLEKREIEAGHEEILVASGSQGVLDAIGKVLIWKGCTGKRNVAFVPGKYFFTSPDEGIETMRLNYTMTDEETIDHAVKILSDALEMGSSFVLL